MGQRLVYIICHLNRKIDNKIFIESLRLSTYKYVLNNKLMIFQAKYL